jgi:hypothetical protein
MVFLRASVDPNDTLNCCQSNNKYLYRDIGSLLRAKERILSENLRAKFFETTQGEAKQYASIGHSGCSKSLC